MKQQLKNPSHIEPMLPRDKAAWVKSGNLQSANYCDRSVQKRAAENAKRESAARS